MNRREFLGSTLLLTLPASVLSSAAFAEDQIQFAAIWREQNPAYQTYIDAMQAEADKLGIKMYTADAQQSVAKQIEAIENYKSLGVKYIFVNVFDAAGIKDTIDKAVADGFYIIVFDGTIPSASLTIGIDNADLGYKIGKAAADFINSTPELKNAETVEWALESYTKVADIIPRAEGIKKGIADNAPNAKLVASEDVYSLEDGVTSTENFLQAHPNIKIIAGVTDSFVIGAYQALNSMGKTGNDIGVFACDGTDEALKAISEKSIYRATVTLTKAETSTAIIDTIYKHAKGEEVPKVLNMGLATADINNIADYWPKK